MPNITGQLVAADLDLDTTGPLTHGTVTFTPYGGDSHVGGEDASLGAVQFSIPTMPSPLPIDAGDWTIRITTDRRIPRAGWLADAFEPKAIDLTISEDISWADIVSQVIDTPVMTPTLVAQAQAFRDQAEVFSATTEELQDAAMEAIDADAGSDFRVQQDARHSALFVKGVVSSSEPDPSVGVWIPTTDEPADPIYAFRYLAGSAILVAANTETTIPYNTEGISSGWWDDALNAWTIPEDGRYAIQANILVTVVADGVRQLRIKQTGSNTRDLAASLISGLAPLTGLSRQPLMAEAQTSTILSAGDKVSATFRHNSAGSINFHAAVNGSSFTIRKLTNE